MNMFAAVRRCVVALVLGARCLACAAPPLLSAQISTDIVEKNRDAFHKRATDPDMKPDGGTQPRDWTYDLRLLEPDPTADVRPVIEKRLQIVMKRTNLNNAHVDAIPETTAVLSVVAEKDAKVNNDANAVAGPKLFKGPNGLTTAPGATHALATQSAFETAAETAAAWFQKHL